MNRSLILPLIVAFCVACAARSSTSTGPASTDTSAPPTQAEIERALSEVRELFSRNIEAIQNRDREAYLACYASTERLVRVSGDGVEVGFTGMAKETPATGSSKWPERLHASEMRVFWIRPGLVYGTYKYDVTIAGKTTSGMSERVFVKREDGWRITVTTAFETP